MEAAEGTPLRPVTTQVVAPAAVPRLSLDGGVHLRCLAGGYHGNADPLAATISAACPVLLLHLRLDAQADGVLTALPSAFNGFLFVIEGSVLAGGAAPDAAAPDAAGSGDGGDGDGGATEALHATAGAEGLLQLPPGGDTLRLRNPSPDAPAMLVLALGRPHRKPYFKCARRHAPSARPVRAPRPRSCLSTPPPPLPCACPCTRTHPPLRSTQPTRSPAICPIPGRYVGYGGGLIHRSLSEVEAAMSEYESDPKRYGRRAVAAALGEASLPEVDMSAYTLVSGFQSNGGEMMERPAEAVARFAYAAK